MSSPKYSLLRYLHRLVLFPGDEEHHEPTLNPAGTTDTRICSSPIVDWTFVPVAQPVPSGRVSGLVCVPLSGISHPPTLSAEIRNWTLCIIDASVPLPSSDFSKNRSGFLFQDWSSPILISLHLPPPVWFLLTSTLFLTCPSSFPPGCTHEPPAVSSGCLYESLVVMETDPPHLILNVWFYLSSPTMKIWHVENWNHWGNIWCSCGKGPLDGAET